MKIAMYELLGMIKDGKVPKRIIYNEYVYQWNNIIKNYEREVDINTTLNWDYIAINCLNEPVEIIEEEKKIPENNFNYIYSCEDEHIMANFENIKTTLKDIIDYFKSKGDE